jgi:hypothetical protein
MINALLVFAVVFVTNLLVATFKVFPDTTWNLLFWAAIVSLVIGFAIREPFWKRPVA